LIESEIQTEKDYDYYIASTNCYTSLFSAC